MGKPGRTVVVALDAGKGRSELALQRALQETGRHDCLLLLFARPRRDGGMHRDMRAPISIPTT